MQSNSEEKAGTWQFRNEDSTPATASQPAAAAQPERTKEPVTWTASEYIAHHKDARWYFLLFAALVSLCGLIYFFTRDIISVVTIVIVALLYLIISKAKPKLRTYTINSQGMSIDDKFYPFHDFKSFTVTQEGAIGCINFLPLKRLLPEISIYFAPDDSARIIEMLVNNLPNDQRQERKTDRLMKRLHF